MLKIEILKGHEQPESRTRRDSNEISWSQKGFAHLGGAFPVEIKIPLQNASHAYSVGLYDIDTKSFRVGQYGNLELSRWELHLVRDNSNTNTLKTAV